MLAMVVTRKYILPVAAATGLALWPLAGAGLGPALAASAVAGPVEAEVERVVDGDTVKVTARIWIDQRLSISVRLSGVDAPELFRPACAAERALAREAKAFVEDMLGAGVVNLYDIHNGKYAGRAVARLETAGGVDVGAALIAAGLAVPDGAADPWCE